MTWPRRLPQVTDGMYGQLAYGMATAVYQVRSFSPSGGGRDRSTQPFPPVAQVPMMFLVAICGLVPLYAVAAWPWERI